MKSVLVACWPKTVSVLIVSLLCRAWLVGVLIEADSVLIGEGGLEEQTPY